MRLPNFRTAFLAAAFLSISLGNPAIAHGDPREMGAGPGVTTEVQHSPAANTEAQPEVADGHSDSSAASDHGDGHGATETGAMNPSDKHGEEMGSMESMGHDHGADNSDKSFGERLFIWLGKLHVAVIHFPIALIVGAFAVELFGAIQNRPQWRSAARIMLVIGAIGAVVAASLGWFAGGFYLVDQNLVLTSHRYLGMVVAIGSIILAWAGLKKYHHEKRNDKTFAALLGLLTAAVLVQAFLGGTFMHGGLNHMNF